MLADQAVELVLLFESEKGVLLEIFEKSVHMCYIPYTCPLISQPRNWCISSAADFAWTLTYSSGSWRADSMMGLTVPSSSLRKRRARWPRAATALPLILGSS